jgi:hypothetical protein
MSIRKSKCRSFDKRRAQRRKANAGPSTPLKNASLRMTELWVDGEKTFAGFEFGGQARIALPRRGMRRRKTQWAAPWWGCPNCALCADKAAEAAQDKRSASKVREQRPSPKRPSQIELDPSNWMKQRRAVRWMT